ncbi:MAG TPA: hypothetical protein VF950_11935 [Planctomycetota bacterium]
MPRVAWSIGLHVLLALILALGWVVPAPEDTLVLRCPRPLRLTQARPSEFEKQVDNHPPIYPKDFQPDRVIINDADEVVENTTPENLRGTAYAGDSTDFVSFQPFLGKTLRVNVGLGGGASGRYGSAKASFG